MGDAVGAGSNRLLHRNCAASGWKRKLRVPTVWQSQHFQSHALAGKLFSGDGNETKLSDLEQQLAKTDFLLIGEIHDNPDHHRWQADVVLALAKSRDHKPAVVFEMVPERLQPVLDGANIAEATEGGSLGGDLEWEARGWPAWVMYRPIFAASLQNGLRLKAGSLDRSQLREISKEGVGKLGTKQLEAYGMSDDLADSLRDDLATELKRSHCDLLPDSSIPAMVDVQRLRDGVMANAIVTANTGDGAVLIAGNGHTRKDRGVPLVLTKRNPGAKIISVGLIEVDPDGQTFDDYGLTNNQGKPLYDFVLFTPKANLTDHCAELRKRFSKDDDKTKRD